MKRLILAGLIILALAALVWAGGDPWKTKPFSQWTDKDVQAVFLSSPWAKPNVQASGAWRPMDSATMSGPTPGAIAGSSTDNSKVSQGTMAEQMGGAEKTRRASEAAASKVYTVLWWSSRTIRAASVRGAVLRGSMTQENAERIVAQPKDDYEVLVQAQNMAIFEQRGEKAFEKVAWLVLKKSNRKVLPTHVTFQYNSNDQVVGAVFYFPRKDTNGEPTISADEKEIDFFIQVGDAKVVTFFEPKKMMDSQGLDL
jgi:hypothetical protein